MGWSFSNDLPIYAQLIEQIEGRILSGALGPGERLPSVRDMAAEAGVNPNTMQRALSELERRGLMYTQRTAGRFVTEDLSLLDQLKREVALRKIRVFLRGMEPLGLKRQELMELLEQCGKE